MIGGSKMQRGRRSHRGLRLGLGVSLLLGAACATASGRPAPAAPAAKAPAPLPVFASTLPAADPPLRLASGSILFTGARIMTATGVVHDPGYLLLREGRIAAVGHGSLEAPADAEVISLSGKVVTPGLIDLHSHLGVYSSPGVSANADGNEATSPSTPEMRAEDGFWPQDPDLERALRGGVTTLQVLPGSSNLIGGGSFVLRLQPGPTSARALRFPGAAEGLKMACGENPKGIYGGRGGPKTRMGNTARLKAIFQRAREYQRKLLRYRRQLARWEAEGGQLEGGAKPADGKAPARRKDPPDPPPRNPGLETLVEVLEGKRVVHNHCYRADEMEKQLDLAAEFGFEIRAFHHASEAYKLRHRLAREGVAVATWTDWWGFKMEAFDGIPQNLALLEEAGVSAIVHSDSASDIRRLNQEAAKAATAGKKIGLSFDDETVLRWITANPARALGLLEQVGTLETGKLGDLVVWSGDPFSVYARVERVYVGGQLLFDRAAPGALPASDFELGYERAP